MFVTKEVWQQIKWLVFPWFVQVSLPPLPVQCLKFLLADSAEMITWQLYQHYTALRTVRTLYKNKNVHNSHKYTNTNVSNSNKYTNTHEHKRSYKNQQSWYQASCISTECYPQKSIYCLFCFVFCELLANWRYNLHSFHPLFSRWYQSRWEVFSFFLWNTEFTYSLAF